MIISQTKNPFLRVIFDEDHDFEGLRAPKVHLDTVLTKYVTPPGPALYFLALIGEDNYIRLYMDDVLVGYHPVPRPSALRHS